MTADRLVDRMTHGPSAGRRVLPWCLLVFLLAAVSLSASAQATIHVPADQPTIQAAINAAANGDTVIVSPGTYTENIDFQGKAITVTSTNGPSVTIIDGGGNGPVVSFHSGELRSSVISGFTLRNGGGDPLTTSVGGGGVYVNSSAPAIFNNIITGNACHGVWSESGAALIQNNEISHTTGTNDYCSFSGSGILLIGTAAVPQASPQYKNNIVIGNTIEQNLTADDYDGGGIFLWIVEGAVIESNTIRNNATTGQGGGIVGYNSDAMLIAQNLITGNSAGYGSGGISLLIPDSSQGPFNGFIQDNTFADNTISQGTASGTPGSQVYIEGNLAQFEFTNNIVVGNSAQPAFTCGTSYNYLSVTPLVIDHNDIYNPSGSSYGGACADQTNTYGNISADPLFAGNGDYHLQPSSPAIDTGNNGALQLIANDGFPLATDLDGNPRLEDATSKGYPIVDMGAYEYAGAQNAQTTTIVLTPSAWTIDGGANLTLNAQLASPAGTPTGTFTFYEDGNPIGTASIDPTGAATLPVNNLIPGPHAFIATYAGSGVFIPAVSVKIYVLVLNYSVTLTIASNPNPSLVNQNVTFTITSNAADGTHPSPIILTDNGNPLSTLTPDANGNAAYIINTLTVGSHLIVASYAGDATHLTAQASLTQLVLSAYPTTTALTSSLNPATVGQSVTFTATTSSTYGTPAGSIAFADNGNPLSTIALNPSGVAVFITATLPIGSHAITATYLPTPSFAPSSASLTQIVNGLPDTTTLTAAPNPALALAPVVLTATVTAASGTPTGTVSFLDGAQIIATGTLNTAGIATATVTFAASGVHILAATYNGDASFAVSTSAPFIENIQANVTGTAVAVTPNPAGALQPITFTATVTSPTAPSVNAGTVTFSVSGNPVGTATIVNGVAIFTVSTLAPGTYTLIGAYSGSGAFQPSTSGPITFVVVPATTTTNLTATPNPALFGSPVTLTATVSAGYGFGTGTVTFLDGTTALGAPVPVGAGGFATLTTSTLALGVHIITANFSGSTNFAASSANVHVTIIGPVGDFSISIKPGSASIYTGESAAFQVTVTPLSNFNQNLSLIVLGTPLNTTANLSATSLPNGSGTLTMTIQSTVPQQIASNKSDSPWPGSQTPGSPWSRNPWSANPWSGNPWSPALGTGAAASLALIVLPARFRRRRNWLALLALCAALVIPGCGAPASVAGGTPPGTYTIEVNATAVTQGQLLSHSATVQLTVKSLFQ